MAFSRVTNVQGVKILMDSVAERKTENIVLPEVLLDADAAKFCDIFLQLFLLFYVFCLLYVYLKLMISLAMMNTIGQTEPLIRESF